MLWPDDVGMLLATCVPPRARKRNSKVPLPGAEETYQPSMPHLWVREVGLHVLADHRDEMIANPIRETACEGNAKGGIVQLVTLLGICSFGEWQSNGRALQGGLKDCVSLAQHSVDNGRPALVFIGSLAVSDVA